MRIFTGAGNGLEFANALNENFARLSPCGPGGGMVGGLHVGGIGIPFLPSGKLFVTVEDFYGRTAGNVSSPFSSETKTWFGDCYKCVDVEYAPSADPDGGLSGDVPDFAYECVSPAMFNGFLPKGSLIYATMCASVGNYTGSLEPAWLAMGSGITYFEGRFDSGDYDDSELSGGGVFEVTTSSMNVWGGAIKINARLQANSDVLADQEVGAVWNSLGREFRVIWSPCG